MKKTLLLTLSLWLLAATWAWAETPLSRYLLDLFGYRIGMSFEEASEVRAFHFVEYANDGWVYGMVDNLYQEDIAFTVRVRFSDERIEQVIGRFDPAEFDKVADSLRNSLGPGEIQTRSLYGRHNDKREMQHLSWAFPGARVDLIQISNNSAFATVALGKPGLRPTSATPPQPPQ